MDTQKKSRKGFQIDHEPVKLKKFPYEIIILLPSSNNIWFHVINLQIAHFWLCRNFRGI